MNWYKKISQLDPSAWKKHEHTHRLLKDMPVVKTPFGKIHQEVRPEEDLEKDYFGVHSTPSMDLASIYANNLGSFDNPPIIFEISTTQKWDIDVDAIMDGFDEVVAIDGEMDIVERIENAENINDEVGDIMDEISNMEIYDADYESDNDFSDAISEKAGYKHPRVIVDYFLKYYSDPVQGFYQKFILPLWFGKGDLDDTYKAYFVGQQRFTKPVTFQEITAIYTVYPYEYEFRHGYSEDEKENYNEEGKYMPDYEDVDYGLETVLLWQNPQAQLFPNIFEVTYHGTNAERAKQAFPQLSKQIDSAKEILDKQKIEKTVQIVDKTEEGNSSDSFN